MNCKLTVPISAQTPSEAVIQAQKASKAGADAIELRADFLKGLTPQIAADLVKNIKNSTNIPLIFTCRDSAEGGQNNYPSNLRLQSIIAAIENNADFIDIEFANFNSARDKILPLLENSKTRLILSTHDFEKSISDPGKIYNDIKAAHPDAIPKIVCTANHINDCFPALDLLHSTNDDLIVLCMSPAGIISRLLAKKLNAFLTFASLEDAAATASGQVTIEQMKNLYRFDKIDEKTALYGIVGSPVAHSKSPNLHNSLFDKTKLNKLYLPLLVDGGSDEFNTFIDNIRKRPWLNFHGLSVTIPHKQNAINYTTQQGGSVESLCDKIGAANTLLLEPDSIKAYNTDLDGALDSITTAMNITRESFKDMSVTIIGAGGVARAIVAGLTDCGANVKIYNRTLSKAKTLAEEFGCDFAPLDELKNINASLVINCTSIGMHPDFNASPLPANLITQEMTVFDTVYNPPRTLLLTFAEHAGAKTIEGTQMFINQAKAQFKLFTNIDAPGDITF